MNNIHNNRKLPYDMTYILPCDISTTYIKFDTFGYLVFVVLNFLYYCCIECSYRQHFKHQGYGLAHTGFVL